MTEYLFCCPTCTEDLVFEGGINHAEAECLTCGLVTVCPAELFASDEAERRMDADRDERLER